MNPEGKKDGPPPTYVDSNPPPYGLNPQPPFNPDVPNPVMVPTAVVQAPAPALGPIPASMNCPSCHANITSNVTSETSTKTHMIALAMCLCGLWPCCIIPYFMDSCRNTNHHCPSCKAYLGQYKR